jgi:3D (Asp-Asp-Asp) domain-containing protein
MNEFGWSQTMVTLVVISVFAAALLSARVPSTFEATAYSLSGTTATGGVTSRGSVAADLAILPVGTRVRITGAGRYSGVYVVKDTGPKIAGAHIDIYMPSRLEAKRFGKRRVRLRVLEKGKN